MFTIKKVAEMMMWERKREVKVGRMERFMYQGDHAE